MEKTKIKFGRGFFYKYKSLEGCNFDQALELIETLAIYCPKPSELNDDDEFRPTFSGAQLSDMGYRNKVDKWVRRCLNKSNPVPTEAQLQAELQALTQERLDAIAIELSKQFYQEVNQKHRVISMTNSQLNHHLWSAYAKNYSGVCFEFEISPWLTAMYEVQYSNEPKKLDLASDAELEQLNVTALTKHVDWSEEKEYRMVLTDPPVEGGPTILNNRLYLLPKMFTGVYFGFRIERMERDALLRAIEKSIPHAKRYLVYGGVPYRNVAAVKL
jgi:hypothetical protein